MSFDVRRLRRADQIIGAGAIAFFVFLFFFNWYGISTNVSSFAGTTLAGGVSKTGWETFTNLRWVWLITILVSLGAVALVVAGRKLETPVRPSMIVTGLGALSTALIVYRIIHHPSRTYNVGVVHASADIKIGIWLGLLAAVAITYGGYLAMQAEGTSTAPVRDQPSSAFSGLTSSAGGGPAPASAGSAPSPPAPSAPAQAPTPPTAPPSSAPPTPPPAQPSSAPPTPPPSAPPTPPPAQPSSAPPIPPPGTPTPSPGGETPGDAGSPQ
jgi:hypothetical protein